MILSDLSDFKPKIKLKEYKYFIILNNEIILTNKKSIIKCDICNKIFSGMLYNYINKKIHICRSCNNIGEKNNMYGISRYGEKNPFYKHKHMEKTKKKISMVNRGYKHTKEAKYKMSILRIGENNPNFGKHPIAWNKGLTKNIDIRVKEGWCANKTKETDERIKKLSITRKKLLEEGKIRSHPYSKISQELFWKIYEQIKNQYKKIYFATLNQETKKSDWSKKNWEWFIRTNKGIRFLDFYIKDINFNIEFLGYYWHKDDYDDLKREYEIKEINSNMKTYYVDELNYKKNKDNELKDILNIIKDNIYKGTEAMIKVKL